ncbi:MAG: UDP-3-O-(3-hydroxymyristoyl)glucosamine N-acyltransferase [Rhodospirillaceae bacterium]|jgi:UDP-3-O-[3-hydroxymyristoyl] glucosamine N-acyltransferase|nr:UDP-3-O-(3-hydroxymyristoyl)glucosamine N-acyltransferase [Rhodospirillaceae bacterium]MBT4771318.1 UDP-3-O-(3-hydroxymyristoyl)glucosamine N-acyltransferase [Rhodospirillaceae bacterium]MBT5359172.1 UDP-3-O-(3-hydroxymyristoyl)glucosamine N-acyltransferase [Rhodospirillaceae bacterium]MBT5769042.1 UDP-3-O-(3-hydroxymyristoyl)glucosamine N-acyltransferase [Rhodospirillaceae bacterium]MBT6310607.1 UDP-3-O-(3-hydroxymyristoyl)glucosamine N-acyltransferase [Rhodospirillaceae bacterium]
MADSRFFENKGPISIADLADVAGATLSEGADPNLMIEDVAPLDLAGPGHLSFLDNRKYVSAFEASKAAACVVSPALADRAPDGMALLLSETPYRGYARIAHAFYPGSAALGGVHSSAFVDDTAVLGDGVAVGANAVIEAQVRLGAGVVIGAGTVVGQGVTVGIGTVIGAGASVSHCDIGAKCDLHPGVRIGTRGFGFDMSAEGHLNVPQLGRVVVGDDVEIGANSTIDRGAGPDTVIGDGCKIDNLVQIGHNVRLGKGCVVIAQAGVAGSATVEDFVILAAQSGVAGHITVATGTQLAARSGLMRDSQPGVKLAGNPAIPAKEYFRQMAVLAKVTKDRGR